MRRWRSYTPSSAGSVAGLSVSPHRAYLYSGSFSLGTSGLVYCFYKSHSEITSTRLNPFPLFFSRSEQKHQQSGQFIEAHSLVKTHLLLALFLRKHLSLRAGLEFYITPKQ